MNLVIVTPYPPAITGIGQYGYHISRSLAQSGQFTRVTVLAGEAPRPRVSPSALPNHSNGKGHHAGFGHKVRADHEVGAGLAPAQDIAPALDNSPAQDISPALDNAPALGSGPGVNPWAGTNPWAGASPAPTINVEYIWKPDHMESGALIRARLRQIKPDLVWYNLGASIFGRMPAANLISLLGLGMAPARGYPSVVTLHELVELADLKTLRAPGGQLAHLAARLLTRVTTRADVVCLTLRRYADWLRVKRPDLTCVHIPIGNYYPAEMLAEPGKPELLFFSSLAPYKGLEVLLAAFRQLLPRYPGLRLTIAGVVHPRFPVYAEKLRRETAGLPGIHWIGQVPEEGVRDLFAHTQLVVLPYHASTGSSSVIYQSAAWGRAMAASDLTDIHTVASENDLEINYFTRGDPISLADALSRSLDHPELRRAQAGHNFAAIQRIPAQETCQLYLQAFNLALAKRHSSKRLEVPVKIFTEAA